MFVCRPKRRAAIIGSARKQVIMNVYRLISAGGLLHLANGQGGTDEGAANIKGAAVTCLEQNIYLGVSVLRLPDLLLTKNALFLRRGRNPIAQVQY